MRSELKNEIQRYFEQIYAPEQSSILETRESSKSLNKDGISLGPMECQILGFLIASLNPVKFVELGTLTGTTALTILHHMPPQSSLWSFEKNEKHAELAQAAWARDPESKSKKLSILVGEALELLPTIETTGPFDGIFIDANKAAYWEYLMWAEKNVRKGGLIVLDNVFLSGAVWTGDSKKGPFNDKQIEVMRRVNKRIADSKLYKSCLIPTDEGLSAAWKLF